MLFSSCQKIIKVIYLEISKKASFMAHHYKINFVFVKPNGFTQHNYFALFMYI